MPALDTVERKWRERQRVALKGKVLEEGKGALIIVGKRDQDKFFSNGPTIFSLYHDISDLLSRT